MDFNMDSNPTLMGLPKEIRTKILTYTGLVKYNQPIGLTHETRAALSRKKWRETEYNADAFPTAVLQINRQLYNEAISILYGENTFYIFYPDKRANQLLSNLRPRTLSTLRKLHVVLDASHPEVEKSFSSDVHNPNLALCEQYIGDVKERVTQVLSSIELQDSWLQLSHFLNKFQLDKCHLSITLDLSLIPREKGNDILVDLTRLPHIDHLDLRLGAFSSQYPVPQHKFQLKEKRLVNRRTQKISDDARLFPWDKLMNIPELFAKVLSFAGITNFEHQLLFTDFHPRGAACCGSCSTNFFDCYCNTRPGVFSSSCTCWSPSILLSILLANRQIHKEATRVFFTTNHFLAKDSFPILQPQLLRLVPLNQKRIHHLDIELRELGTPEDWISFFNLLQYTCHSQLCLTIRLDRRFFHHRRLLESRFLHFLDVLPRQEGYDGPYVIAVLACWNTYPKNPEEGPVERMEQEIWRTGRRYVVEEEDVE